MGSQPQPSLEPVIEWAAGLRWEDLSLEVQQRARCVLMDDLGAVLAGSFEPEARALRAVLADGSSEATILSETFPRCTRHNAAEINGLAGACLELDEGYRSAPCHAGLYTIPAILAASEWLDVTVGQCHAALVVGYEFATRCARSWRFEPSTLHPHGVFAAVASAAAMSKLLGHSTAEYTSAVTSAATLAFASPFNHALGGALVRNLWAGSGGRLGMLAAELAPHGIAGLESATDDVFGRILGGRPDTVMDRPEQDPAILDGFHKLYACCQYLHSGIDALLTIRRASQDRAWPSEITGITVWAHRAALNLSDTHPDTTLGAKFSMQHALAAVAALGSGGISAFSNAALRDATIAGLREQVRMEALEDEWSSPGERAALVQVRFIDDHTEEQLCRVAPGEPGRRLDAHALLNKFVEVTGLLWSKACARTFGTMLIEGPADQRVRDLLGHLTRGDGANA